MCSELIPLFSEDEPSFSKEQKTFNSRIKKINKLRQKLAGLEVLAGKIKHDYFKHVEPQRVACYDARERVVRILDDRFEQLAAKDKKKAEIVIAHSAYELISSEGRDSLIPIHDKYSEESYELLCEDANDAMREYASMVFSETLDLDVNFDDLDDMQDFRKIFERVSDAAKARFEDEPLESASDDDAPRTDKKREKEDTEVLVLTKLCKSMYNKLVKALHPDLEQDHQLRDEKTQIMKELTTAYAKNDIHTLLKIQSQLKSEGLSEFKEICPDSQLRHLNKLLLEQIKELEASVFAFSNPPPLPGHDYLEFFQYGRRYRSFMMLSECEYEDCYFDTLKDCEKLEQNMAYVRSYLQRYIKAMEESEEESGSFEDLLFGNLR